MDKCFVPCGCDGRDGISKSDLDRFTDKIENVLSDEKGKRLFRNFMRTCQMWSGIGRLDLLEKIDQIVNNKTGNEELAIERLLEQAETVDELDFALMEKLYIARGSDNKEDMIDAIKLLKTETIKTFRTEYEAFSHRYTPTK